MSASAGRARILAVSAVCAAVAVIAVLLLGGGDDGYRVRLEVADAGGLRVNSDVKVAGVPAGTVKRMSVSRDDHAIIEIRLDPEAAPIGAGATARVRPVNLLGEKYLDLDPGNAAEPQPSGARIPLARTSTPVELDDVLNALDPDVRARLRILLNEGGVALLGRGTDVNRLLATLPDTTAELTTLLADVNRQTAALREGISSGRRVASAIAGRSDDVTRLVEEADRALAPLADRRAELGATLQRSPAALRTLRGALGSLDVTAGRLVTTSRQLRRTAPPLAATLRAVPGFTAAAHGTLLQARAAAPSLTRLADRATPVLRRLRPSAGRLDETAELLDPLTRTLDEGGAGDDTLRLMENWSRTITGRDGLGHLFRTHLAIDATQQLRNAMDKLRPPAKQRKPSRSPQAPVHRPLLPLPPKPSTGSRAPTIAAGVQQVGATVDRLLDTVLSGGGDRSQSDGNGLGRLIDSLLAP